MKSSSAHLALQLFAPASFALAGFACTSIIGVDGDYVEASQLSEATSTISAGGGGAPSTGASPTVGGAPTVDSTTTAAAGGGACSNRALLFDDDDHVVTVPSDAALDSFGPVTVEAWIKPGEDGLDREQRQYIVAHHDSFNMEGFRLFLDEAGALAFRYYGDGSFAQVGGDQQSKLAAGQWYHVAATFDEVTLRTFVNGQLQDEVVSEITNADDCNCSLAIGSNQSAYSKVVFNGHIDEVRLSKTARYTQSFAPPSAPFGTQEADTIALWHFEEASGVGVLDAMEQHHGSLGIEGEDDKHRPSRKQIPCIGELLN